MRPKKKPTQYVFIVEYPSLPVLLPGAPTPMDERKDNHLLHRVNGRAVAMKTSGGRPPKVIPKPFIPRMGGCKK